MESFNLFRFETTRLSQFTKTQVRELMDFCQNGGCHKDDNEFEPSKPLFAFVSFPAIFFGTDFKNNR